MVLERSQMQQKRDHVQIEHCFQVSVPNAFVRDVSQVPAGMINAAVNPAYYPQSEVNCNDLSFRCKRNRAERNISNTWSVYQQLNLLNSPKSATICNISNISPSLVNVASGLNESSASLSVSLPLNASTTCPDILSLVCHQRNEVEILLRNQNEKLRLGIHDAQKRHHKELISVISQLSMKRLKEKDAELENICRKNVELEEKTKQMNAESLIWFNIAKNNEAIISSLRSRLDQAILKISSISIPPAKEGDGDRDDSPFPLDDAQSCCFDTTAIHEPLNGKLRCRTVCIVCKENHVSVLLLPCRHLCICLSCVAGIDTCPICHSIKNAILQIYFE